MTQLDDKIREALEETGIESPDFGDDDTLRSMISDAYAGKLRWMFVLWTFWQLVFFIGFVYAGVELFSMVSSEDPLFWAALSVANTDASNAGEHCMRCHTAKGWLENRVVESLRSQVY